MNDQELREVIKKIIESSENSRDYQQALNQLLDAIPQLPGIYKVNDSNYDDAFNEALGNIAGISREKHTGGKHTLLKFVQTTKLTFSPPIFRKKFVNFFNGILQKRLIDWYRQEDQALPLDEFIRYNEEGETFIDRLADTNISGLDALLEEEELKANQQNNERLTQKLENADFPLEIAEKLLDFPEGYPNATCKELILRRKVKKQSWSQILKELQLVPENLTNEQIQKTPAYRTAASHYSRKCKPLLQELANLNLLNLLQE